MANILEKSGIAGRVVVREINPKAGEVVSEESVENLIYTASFAP